LDVLQWMGTKGALLGDPCVGWSIPVSSSSSLDPDILILSALHGHVDVLGFLIGEMGIRPASAPHLPLRSAKAGWTALHAACRGGHVEAASSLLRFGVNSLMTAHGQRFMNVCLRATTALGEAVRSGSLAAVRLLLTQGDADWNMPPITTLAAFWGHRDVMRAILEARPGAATDEAYSLAIILRNREMERDLAPRSSFAWTELAAQLFASVPIDEAVRIVARYPISTRLMDLSGCPRDVFWPAVKAMVPKATLIASWWRMSGEEGCPLCPCGRLTPLALRYPVSDCVPESSSATRIDAAGSVLGRPCAS
jgi:hypothetical protein